MRGSTVGNETPEEGPASVAARSAIFDNTRVLAISVTVADPSIRIQKWSGGPGFEPGASRSRNLGCLVYRDRSRGFEFISGINVQFQASSIHQLCLKHYTNYYMGWGSHVAL